MKAFAAMLRVSFLNLLLNTLNTGRSNRKKRKAVSGVSALVLLCALMLFISGIYSFSFGVQLAAVGQLDVMLMMMAIGAVGFPLMLTIFSAQSLLFSSKDVDLVLSLPVSAFTVMLSRMFALYLEILLMVELFLIPAGAAWLVFGGGGGALFFFLLLLEGAFLALLPTLASMLVGCLISLIVSRLPFKNLFMVVFSLLFIVLIMVGSFTLSGTSATMGENAGSLRTMIEGAFPPVVAVVHAATGPNWLYLLAVAAVCLLPFLAVTWVFSKFYKSMLTRLLTHTVKKGYKLGKLAVTGSFGALYRKEAGRFFGTPAFVVNSGFGTILILLAGVAAVVFKGEIARFMAVFEGIPGGVLTYLPAALLGFMAFFLLTSSPSAVSISLEGKSLWILKEAPVSTRQIFAAKAGFSFTLGAVGCVVAVPLIGYAFGLPALDTALVLVILLLFEAFNALSGLQVNLAFPRMDETNETIVIKQSSSVIIAMLLDLVPVLLLVGAYVVCAVTGLGNLVFYGIAAAFLLLMDGLVVWRLATKGRKRFEEL